MSRYAKITDGANVVDIAKGELGFNYYLFTRPGGSGIIMREKTDETEYRFYLFAGKNTQAESATNTQAQWDDRANKGYLRPSDLKSL